MNYFSQPLKLGNDGSIHDCRLSSLRKDEVETLFEITKRFKPEKTLEVGLALSASCMAIILAKKELNIPTKHISLDPFQLSLTKNAGLIELERISLKESLDFRSEFSESFLNTAYRDNEKFDLIFIDGPHTIGQAVTDAFLSDKILNPNGIIAIHDALLFSTAASVKYLIWEKNYHVVGLSKYNLKSIGRMLKYSIKLGLWYSWHIIPKISSSLIVVQKK